MEADREAGIEKVALLADPVRRALYDAVTASPSGELSRDDAAEAVGIKRPLAAFHLDRLVQAGLLKPAFRRIDDRSGPGAGRPTKFYRRSPERLKVAVPDERLEVMGRFLVQSLLGKSTEEVLRRARRIAYASGKDLGRAAHDGAGDHPSVGRIRAQAINVLDGQGYNPVVEDGGRIRLRNCPFHALASQAPEVVCDLNLAMLRGFVVGLGPGSGLKALFQRVPEECCVCLTSVGAAPATG